ncbi:hypothetical protein GCM10010407_15600 [Rarobacter incanus]
MLYIPRNLHCGTRPAPLPATIRMGAALAAERARVRRRAGRTSAAHSRATTPRRQRKGGTRPVEAAHHPWVPRTLVHNTREIDFSQSRRTAAIDDNQPGSDQQEGQCYHHGHGDFRTGLREVAT